MATWVSPSLITARTGHRAQRWLLEPESQHWAAQAAGLEGAQVPCVRLPSPKEGLSGQEKRRKSLHGSCGGVESLSVYKNM